MNQPVLGHSKPDRSSLRILQHFRDLTGRRQDERVGPWRERLDQSVRPVVDARVGTDLGQVCTHQREIVVLVCLPNTPDALDCLAIANVTAECIARICRIRDQRATLYIPHHHGYASCLRVVRMTFDEFRHARIVGERSRRGYPRNTLLFAAIRQAEGAR